MVTTPDANGVVFLEIEDGPPIPAVINVPFQAVSDALGNMRTFKTVADITERTALKTSFAPTPAKPLLVYRANGVGGSRFEISDGGDFKNVSPVGGIVTGPTNVFGQIAIPHGLGYVPSIITYGMANDVASGDSGVTESAVKDYTVTLYNQTSELIIVRLVNQIAHAWAGAGARFAVQWTAR